MARQKLERKNTSVKGSRPYMIEELAEHAAGLYTLTDRLTDRETDRQTEAE